MPITDLGSIIPEAQIDPAIARDIETAAAVAAHAGASDPHPIYLTQAEGDAQYRQKAVALVDSDIPSAIARDTEYVAADAAHIAATDPHPSLWTRIANAFLALAGGQAIIKNNPTMSAVSFQVGQNHLELRTTDGSNPAIGFHRAGFTATALYHLGYGNDSLRIRNADGYDSELLHNSNHVLIPGFHSVRCTLFSTIVAAVGSETIVSFSPIPFAKIVGIRCQMIENLGVSGMRFVSKDNQGDFGAGSVYLNSGFVRVPAVTASQLVGIPLHILIWHIP